MSRRGFSETPVDGDEPGAVAFATGVRAVLGNAAVPPILARSGLAEGARWEPRRGVIVVDEQLLRTASLPALRATGAHEAAHVRDGGGRLFVSRVHAATYGLLLVVPTAAVLAFFALNVPRLSQGRRFGWQWLLGVAVTAVFVVMPLVMRYVRRRERDADVTAARTVGFAAMLTMLDELAAAEVTSRRVDRFSLSAFELLGWASHPRIRTRRRLIAALAVPVMPRVAEGGEGE